jgi:uncharacterized membrane-anchored protein YitT (DUF2179 family)
MKSLQKHLIFAFMLKNQKLSGNLKSKKTELASSLKNFFFIALGVLSAGFGLKSLLLPSHFIDGGATGISLLITELTQLPFSFVIMFVNLPFLILGYRQFGKGMAWSTALAIAGLALAVQFFPYPIVTNDKLLVATFGGFFLGGGIGLAMRGGAVLDGTEILALTLSNKTTASVGDIILLFNLVIFSFAAYLLGIESALYSVLTYMVASKAVDFLVEGLEEYTGITIISDEHADEIAQMIVDQFGRGITIYKGTKGHGKRGTINKEKDIIFTVVTRLEVTKIKSQIISIDPTVFFVLHSIKDIRGGIIKKRPLKID